MESFGRVLKEFRQDRRIMQYVLAGEVNVDRSYLQRVEGDRRPPPSRQIVVDLAQALRLEADERDRFYAAAGLLPPSAEGLERWAGALTSAITVLADDVLTEESRREYAHLMGAVAIRWRAAGG